MHCDVSVLDKQEYLDALRAKLHEEVAEYMAVFNVEELADILEVVYTLALAQEHSLEGLEKLRQEKKKSRGAFEQRLFLRSTTNEGTTFF